MKRRIAQINPLLIATGFFLGFVSLFYKTMLSGLDKLPGDLGDTRFNHYLLEHSFQWLSLNPKHLSFWSPPFFAPQENVLAFSDTLISVAPLYWIFRLAEFQVSESIIAWYSLVFLINFLAAIFFFSQFPKMHPYGVLLAAYLFTFANSRQAHFSHIQLLPQFYCLLSVAFLLRAFIKGNSPRLHLVIASLCYLLQWYASFYLAWMTTFVLGFVVFILALQKDSRTHLLSFLNRNRRTLVFCFFLTATFLSPLALKYLEAKGLVGERSLAERHSFLPSLYAIFYHGKDSVFYSGVLKNYSQNYGSHEHEFGFGILTLAISSIGLVRCKLTHIRTTLISTILFSILLTTKFAEGISLWPFISSLLPAGDAIRAAGRIHLILLTAWGIGLGYFVSSLFTSRLRGLSLGLTVIVVSTIVFGENLRRPRTYSYLEAQKPISILATAMQKASNNCKYFFYATTGGKLEPWKYQVDTMWAGLIAQKAVINGYSGNTPPGWNLYHAKLNSTQDYPRLEKELRSWARSQSLPLRQVCWLLPGKKKLELVDHSLDKL